MEILHQPITNTAMIGALIVRDIVEIDHINKSLEDYINKRIVEKQGYSSSKGM